MRNIWSIAWAHDRESRALRDGVPLYWHVLRTLSHVPHIAGILLAARGCEDSLREFLLAESPGVPVRLMPEEAGATSLLPHCQAFLALDCTCPFANAAHTVRLCDALDRADIVFTAAPKAQATMPFAVRRDFATNLSFLPDLPEPGRDTQIIMMHDETNHEMKKITEAAQTGFSIGQGYDVHRFGGSRPLVLGGVPIPTDKTIEAHSAGDVLLHAIADALLGAAAMGDIGDLFPPDAPRFDGISSGILLDKVVLLLKEKGICPVHIDCTVIAQKPKIAPYRTQICTNVARLLCLPRESVNIKATTEEKLGFTGRCEGIKAQAVVLCQKFLS